MHDLNGTPLAVGDRISVEFVITVIHPYTDYCNISAQSVHGRKPDGASEYFTGNSAVTVLQKKGPA